MRAQAASQHAQIGAVHMRADIQTTANNIMLLWIGGKGKKTVHSVVGTFQVLTTH